MLDLEILKADSYKESNTNFFYLFSLRVSIFSEICNQCHPVIDQ